ncbi:MAG: hypothetical protein QM723_01335 [Myxococcaceae bacterium]
MRLHVLLLSMAVTSGACAGCDDDHLIVHFEIAGDPRNDSMVARFVDGDGGTLSDSKVRAGRFAQNGSVELDFHVPLEVPVRLQYFVDENGNKKWDGPVATGEPSWDRALTIKPTPDGVEPKLFILWQTDFAAVPDDLVAP